MTAIHFFDTNILLYSVSSTPSEARKRDIAILLLDQDNGGLSVQVLQEFYVQATRATSDAQLSHNLAAGFIESWTRFTVQDMTLQVLRDALHIKAAHGYSYWDSAIIAAAQALGCQTLYSEDMRDGHVIGGLRIENPFREIGLAS